MTQVLNDVVCQPSVAGETGEVSSAAERSSSARKIEKVRDCRQ